MGDGYHRKAQVKCRRLQAQASVQKSPASTTARRLAAKRGRCRLTLISIPREAPFERGLVARPIHWISERAALQARRRMANTSAFASLAMSIPVERPLL